MKHFKGLCLFILLAATVPLQAQIVYPFATVHSPAGCQYTYDIDITLKMDSAIVTNIYFDDMVSSGSFAFEVSVSYDIVFSNSTLPPGNFFTFQPTLYTENASINSPSLTNDLGTVPLVTSSSGGYLSLNNPTYTGSASAMGLLVNNYNSSLTILNALGYDHATLRINLPCLDTLIEADEDPLPVTWAGFSASEKNGEITLQWQTVMENLSSHYSIQRSTDAKSWAQVGTTPSKAANGESAGKISYQYTLREELPGTYYFKIVQTDFDGTETPSSIIAVNIPVLPGQSAHVYPNPADTEISLAHTSPNTNYEIYDSKGRQVSGGIYNGKKIPLNGFSPGIYLIKTSGKTSRVVVR